MIKLPSTVRYSQNPRPKNKKENKPSKNWRFWVKVLSQERLLHSGQWDPWLGLGDRRLPHVRAAGSTGQRAGQARSTQESWTVRWQDLAWPKSQHSTLYQQQFGRARGLSSPCGKLGAYLILSFEKCFTSACWAWGHSFTTVVEVTQKTEVILLCQCPIHCVVLLCGRDGFPHHMDGKQVPQKEHPGKNCTLLRT